MKPEPLIPRHPCWNILVWDRGDIRWWSGGAFALKEEAEKFVRSWDRLTGPDGHKVYALGVFEMDPANPALRSGEVLRALESALAELERYRRGRAGLGRRGGHDDGHETS